VSFQVAARVKSDDEKDEWFVVKVMHFDKETKEYVSILYLSISLAG
jgi:SAGA-associated factor 29